MCIRDRLYAVIQTDTKKLLIRRKDSTNRGQKQPRVRCRRQWALIHVEQQWEENVHTVIGELMHKRAHDPYLTEKRAGVLVNGKKGAMLRKCCDTFLICVY